jgi:hypothetical protein
MTTSLVASASPPALDPVTDAFVRALDGRPLDELSLEDYDRAPEVQRSTQVLQGAAVLQWIAEHGAAAGFGMRSDREFAAGPYLDAPAMRRLWDHGSFVRGRLAS